MKFPVKSLAGLAVITLALLFSCSKEGFTNSSSALLLPGADSLHFDTVFTTAGSTTQVVKIFNNNDQGIHIGSIKLGGGASSPFHINVNGIAGPQVTNLDLAANDSAYIFVTVSVDPTNTTLPFIVRDSIGLSYNGNQQFIQLDAYGRNARVLKNKVISSDEVWNNDLPYLISGKLTVAPGATLTINHGCRLYLHGDASFVVDGTLKVYGNDSSRVIFTGDRLDDPYKDYPGSYSGLSFSSNSNGNVINYALIKNANQAIAITGASTAAKLLLNETIIDNAADAGLIASNSNIMATNLLVSNCGKNIVLTNGGSYSFTHCTAASYATGFVPHKNPCLTLSNYSQESNSVSNNDLNATFRNCIFWGQSNSTVSDEVAVLKQGNSSCNIIFDQVLWRVQNNPAEATVYGAINNQDPVFDSINTFNRVFDFRLKAASPAIDKGVNAGVWIDLNGARRPVGMPDLGAYESQN